MYLLCIVDSIREVLWLVSYIFEFVLFVYELFGWLVFLEVGCSIVIGGISGCGDGYGLVVYS